MKPTLDINVPQDTEAQGEGAQRIRETRKALYDIFPISPADLDYESTSDFWPSGSLTGGFDPEVADGTVPPHPTMQNKAFLIGDNTLTYDYTIPAGKNAISPGPIDVGNTTVEIPEGSTWTVVGDNDTDLVYLRDLEDVNAGSSITDQQALLWQDEYKLWYPGPAPRGHDGMDGSDGLDGIQGPTGSPGAPGTGIDIIGTVSEVTDLPGYPDSYEGDVGDAFLVSTPDEVWSWGGDGTWHNLGPIQGPAGADGSQGPRGESGEEGPPSDTPGPQGEIGPKGDDGLSGSDGESGLSGIPGDTGAQGDVGPQGPTGEDSTIPGPPGETGPEGTPGDIGLNSVLPSHLNVPGTLRGRGTYALINPDEPTGDVGTYVMREDDEDYIYIGRESEQVEVINDLADVEAINRIEGSTLAWDGVQYVSADFPEIGQQGPEGDQGVIGPDGIRGPRGPDGDQGPIGPEGPVGQGVPPGCIIMWSGALVAIPDSYLLCNGLNGTPDLREKFIMGAGTRDTGEEGGGTSGSTAISTSQMPSHAHSWSGSGGTGGGGYHNHSLNADGIHKHSFQAGGDHTHTVSPVVMSQTNLTVGSSGQNAKGAAAPGSIGITGGSHTHALNNSSSHTHHVNHESDHTHSISLSGNTNSVGSGSGHTHSVVPKYYSLAYIMKEY